MIKKYQVFSSRHDIPERAEEEFSIIAKTRKLCDKAAIERFKEHVFKKEHDWDDLTLRRIDVEPIIRDVAYGCRLKALRKLNLPDDYKGLLPRDDD